MSEETYVPPVHGTIHPPQIAADASIKPEAFAALMTKAFSTLPKGLNIAPIAPLTEDEIRKQFDTAFPGGIFAEILVQPGLTPQNPSIEGVGSLIFFDAVVVTADPATVPQSGQIIIHFFTTPFAWMSPQASMTPGDSRSMMILLPPSQNDLVLLDIQVWTFGKTVFTIKVNGHSETHTLPQGGHTPHHLTPAAIVTNSSPILVEITSDTEWVFTRCVIVQA